MITARESRSTKAKTEQETSAEASGSRHDRLVMHSFDDEKGRRWTACCECNRGGNGNDEHKCSCGWRATEWNGAGCFLGTAIIGEVKKVKASRSKQRYRRYLEYGDGFDSFIDYCRWDADPDRSWNCA